MRIKTTLKNIYDITDYVKNVLEELGFLIIEDSSKLSDSRYLTVTNWRASVGKGNDDLLIRISNHDLPPSYDGKYGYYDFDLKSKYDDRKGLLGDAKDYGEFIEYVVDLMKDTDNVEIHEIDKILSDKKFLDYLFDNIKDNALRFKIMDLQELKTIRQVKSYIDDYLYDEELEQFIELYMQYLK